MSSTKYEAVIGLEVHAQLATKSKMYCSDIAEFGGLPNTFISEVSLGHPGSLPVVNELAIEYAVKIGLALNCKIRHENQFARKNYFYADLPKGYQITQDQTPICNEGHLDIETDKGTKRIGITRIHMEEDAGKSMHDQDASDSLVDLNRAGVPLVEIVSEPDLRSSDEAYAYLTEVRKLVRYLEICDGNMEEGSMRCDANVSIRPVGQKELGNRVEVKNMNSIRNVKRAIDHEIERQIEVVTNGGFIDQNTLNFDAATGTTSVLRSKEDANDYRYFPEPDLPPVFVTDEYVNDVRKMMPPLPQELQAKYVKTLGLSDYDAINLTSDKYLALYFEDVIAHTTEYKVAANWMMGSVKSLLNEQAIHIKDFALSPEKLAELINLVNSGKVNNSVATQTLFPAMVENPTESALTLAQKLNLVDDSNEEDVIQFIDQALALFPEKVEEYKNGKKGLLGLFMGEVMKLSKGKLNPKDANELLRKRLDN
jgi:aspartyl-tRNA(Asn)/glutamyl-tRNA(Gln) amidotransferase subunit B